MIDTHADISQAAETSVGQWSCLAAPLQSRSTAKQRQRCRDICFGTGKRHIQRARQYLTQSQHAGWRHPRHDLAKCYNATMFGDD
jgi:hypothetical protein